MSNSNWLKDLIDEALTQGWASGKGSIENIRAHAAMLNLANTPIRRGTTSATKLRAMEPDQAPPRSLSAKYGKGPQPLHTDGAHLLEPPDIVILSCASTSETPTRLWRDKRGFIIEEYFRHGVFLVNNGKESFFTNTYENGRLRYDPGCMIPCDQRARRTSQHFDGLLDSAQDFTWDEPGKFLIVDNRRTLHARASVIDDDREIDRLAYRLIREEQ